MEGNIDANDFHGRTSWPARNDRSLHPSSRVKEARGLNQPIGIMETEDRLFANLKGWMQCSPLSPNIAVLTNSMLYIVGLITLRRFQWESMRESMLEPRVPRS